MNKLNQAIEQNFDPSDTDSASQLANECLELMKAAQRCIVDDNANLKMGRDSKAELQMRVFNVANCLKLVQHDANASDYDQLIQDLTS